MMERRLRVISSLLVRSLPADVRKALYTDTKFCERIGIETAAAFALGKDVSVRSISLLDALRAAVDGRKSTRLILADGKGVRVKLSVNKGGSAVVHLGAGAFQFENADVLSSKTLVRRKALKRIFKEQPLLKEEEERWSKVTSTRKLSKDEFLELMTALEGTPEALSKTLQKLRELSPEAMVPFSREYYTRLLAPISVGQELRSFGETALKAARQHVLAENRRVGMRRIAYSNLWQPLLPLDLLRSVRTAEVSTLLDSFDPFSLLFGFELCRARVEKSKSFEQLGTKFLEKLFGDDAMLRRRCEMFSACAIVTTVSLRKTFDEASVPLSWFRLAAFTHAGLLADALCWITDAPDFFKWVVERVGTSFLWYVLYDRRDAPRWRSEWLSPEQVEAELLGRALNAVALLRKGRYPKAWRDVVDKFVARQRDRNRLVDSSFPGPLDDFGDRAPTPKALQTVIDEFERSLKAATNIAEVKGLTGLAYLANPSPTMVQELTRLLGACLPAALNQDVLDACAHIAAGSRSEELARAVVNQCLRELREGTSNRAVAKLYVIMLEACAAVADPKRYSELVGEVSAALALTVPQTIPMIGMRSIFEALTYRDPKLLAALSRASAHLDTLEMRRT